MFKNSAKIWNWLVVSSTDPNSVALTVQGVFSMTIVQTLFGLLPYIGIHPMFTLAMVGAGAYSFIYSVLTALSFLITAYGLLRKVIVSAHDLIPRPASATSTLASALAALKAEGSPPSSATGSTPPGESL
jgi:hypothetical protein